MTFRWRSPSQIVDALDKEATLDGFRYGPEAGLGASS